MWSIAAPKRNSKRRLIFLLLSLHLAAARARKEFWNDNNDRPKNHVVPKLPAKP